MRVASFLGLLSLCFTHSSLAAPKTWDGGGGSNRWGTSSNWNSNGVPGSGDTALFDNSSMSPLPSTIELRGNRSINILDFDTRDTLAIVNGTGNRTLNLYSGQINRSTRSSGSQSLDFTYLNLRDTGIFDINGKGDFTISSIIRDAGSSSGNPVIKVGTGLLIFSGANTYLGETVVKQGTLRIENDAALGNSKLGTLVGTDATMGLWGGITVSKEDLNLNGKGDGGTGALRNVKGTNSWSGNIELGSDATITSASSGEILYLGNSDASSLFKLGSSTLTIDGPGDTYSYSNIGVSGDTGGLVKNGTGKLTYYGYNSFYTGATTVNARSVDLLVGPFSPGYNAINGALTIGAGSSNPADAGTVSVNIAYNSYENQISSSSDVTINSDGILNAGNSTGMGSLTLRGGEILIDSGKVISPTGNIASGTNSAHLTSRITGGEIALSGATGFTVARDATLSSDLTVSSVISGTGASVNKAGTGILTFEGTTANTFTGGIKVNDGTLNLNKTAGVNVMAASGTITVGDNIGAANSATLGLLASNQMPDSTALVLNSDGRIAMGTSSDAVSTIAGTGQIDLGPTGKLTIGGDNSSSVFAGSVTGAGTLEKQGTGTLRLDTDLSYAGALNLGGGTLALNGITLNVGELNITGNSVIDFAGVSSTLFAGTLNFLSTSITLNIINWNASIDYFFASNWTGATHDIYNDNGGAKPMSQIVFNAPDWNGNNTSWDSYDDQIYPTVPEPTTYGALLIGVCAVLVWSVRRRRLS